MKLEPNRVYEMDCLDGFARIEEPISVIVTSPPYNIGKPYNSYKDKMAPDKYLHFI